ncbi:olfactory receptor 12D1-like [Pelodytes ibericus]
MEELNRTSVAEFILLRVTGFPRLWLFLFITFLVFYLFNLMGNLSIVCVVFFDHHLHTPMYFLLGNLSFLDFFYSSVTVPKMLAGLLVGDRAISFEGCMAQLYFFHFFGSTEAMLLTSMSYDRYIAICNPLRYHFLMGKSACIYLASSCWLVGLVYSLTHTILTSKLPFCGINNIAHFYCDIKPLLRLACTDTHLNERMVTYISGFVAVLTFLLIVISYAFIGTHLLNIRSTKDRSKAFSTCISHLTVVLLYFGTAFSTYLGPSTDMSLDHDRVSAVIVTVITPALNPLIYSLRNNDVIRALKKVFVGSKNF